MKRFLFLVVLAIYTLVSHAASPVAYENCTPNSGSDIVSWDFKLKFDISDAVAEAGDGEFGIGYTAATGQMASLFKVDNDEKTLLATTLTTKYVGNSPDFKGGNDIVDLSFDASIPILPGQKYQVEITNTFALYKVGKAAWVSNTLQKFIDNPLVLTFYGGTTSSSSLRLIESSVTNGDNLSTLSSFTVRFDNPVVPTNSVGGSIKEAGQIISTGVLSVDANDPTLVSINFENSTPLWFGQVYEVELEEGAVSLLDNSDVKNTSMKWTINGTKQKLLNFASSTPENGESGIFENIVIKFEVPEGYTLTPPGNAAYKGAGYLYKDEITESNLLGKFFGKITSEGEGQNFDISQISPEPNTKYFFVKPANDITLWHNGLEAKEFTNEEVTINWTTPTVEDLSIAPIQLGTPKIGDYADKASKELEDGGTYANINTLDILEPEYSYNGQTYKTTLDWNNAKILIYDITDGTRKVVKEERIAVAQREGYYEYFGVFVLHIEMDFLEGHDYEIAIPKGTIRLLDNKPLYNYVINDEIVYTVKGATPSEFKIENCSIENGAEMSELPSAIVWKLNGAYALKSSETTGSAAYSGKVGDLIVSSQWKPALTIFREGYVTYASLQLGDPRTGLRRNLRKGEFLTVTIPEGAIIYPGDESISNPELTLTLQGSYVGGEVIEPQMVNVSLSVDGVHTAIHQTAKGQPYLLKFTPENNWVVESVTHDGKALDEIGEGEFVTEPLEADAELKASLKYNGSWAIESTTTHVWEIENSKVKIFADGNLIVVEGVTPEQTISVYNIAGLLINTGHVANGTDKAYITVAPGQTYIVTVDGIAAKITLK